MLLNNRQIRIIQTLEGKQDEYTTATELAALLDVSLRTTQSEISELIKSISDTDAFGIESIRSKGYRLIITNNEEYRHYLDDAILHKQDTLQLNDANNRVSKLMEMILFSKRELSYTYLANNLYISESTLTNDLKKAKEIFKKYNLNLFYKTNKGVYVGGKETDKRKCILNEKLKAETENAYFRHGRGEEKEILAINQILIKVLSENEYSVSDIALENLIAHIIILLSRVELGFNSDASFNVADEEYALELKISEQILTQLEKEFHITFQEGEKYNLAILMKGKRDYYDDAYISKEIDDFVLNSLLEIDSQFGGNYSDDIQLRVCLALHLLPLFSRVKYNSQLKNELLPRIRKNFPIAFDMASSMAYKIMSEFGYELTEDEVSFLTIYFNVAIKNKKNKSSGKKLAVISNMKKSESLFLREMINAELGNMVSKIDILNSYNLDQLEENDYDVLLSLDENEFTRNAKAIKINRYPKKEDINRIKTVLDGLVSSNQFIEYLSPDIIRGDFTDKEELLITMCKQVEPGDQIYAGVMNREKYGGTFFGNNTAVPHPLYPVSNKTTIVIAIPDKPIIWNNEGLQARLILLVSMEKDNPASQTVWSYMSSLLNEKTVNKLLKMKDIEEIKKYLHRELENTKIKDSDDFFEE